MNVRSSGKSQLKLNKQIKFYTDSNLAMEIIYFCKNFLKHSNYCFTSFYVVIALNERYFFYRSPQILTPSSSKNSWLFNLRFLGRSLQTRANLRLVHLATRSSHSRHTRLHTASVRSSKCARIKSQISGRLIRTIPSAMLFVRSFPVCAASYGSRFGVNI